MARTVGKYPGSGHYESNRTKIDTAPPLEAKSLAEKLHDAVVQTIHRSIMTFPNAGPWIIMDEWGDIPWPQYSPGKWTNGVTKAIDSTVHLTPEEQKAQLVARLRKAAQREQAQFGSW